MHISKQKSKVSPFEILTLISENLKIKLKIKQQIQTQALCPEKVGLNLVLTATWLIIYPCETAELFEREEGTETLAFFKVAL